MEEELSWSDSELVSSIIESAKKYGDIRHRNIAIQPIPFMDVHNFYARAFGGIFVFRDLPSGTPLLVFLDKEVWQQDGGQDANAFHVSDPAVFSRLEQEGVLTIGTEWYKQNPEELQWKWEYLVMDGICLKDDGLDYDSLSSACKKKHIRENEGDFPETLYELEHFMGQLRKDLAPRREELSPELARILMRPKEGLPPLLTEVLSILVYHTVPLDPYGLYEYDKNEFAKRYNTWTASKQRYVKNLITKSYSPKYKEA